MDNTSVKEETVADSILIDSTSVKENTGEIFMENTTVKGGPVPDTSNLIAELT